MAGWISLHRKLMDNPIYSNANMLKLWIHCLMKATHTEREQLIGNQMVKLEVGQFVTGRNALADEFNKGAKKDDVVSAITLWRWLKNFEEWQMLNIKTTTKYSVVTVSNWSEHQQHEQQVNNKRTTDEQQVNTNNNVNNSNNVNKNITSTSADADKDFGKIVSTFDANVCPLSPMQIESLEAWFKDFDHNTEIIMESIKLAADRNKKSFGFVEFILREWANNNLKNIEQIHTYERNKFPKQNHKPGVRSRYGTPREEHTPEWFGKEPAKPQTKSDPDIEREREQLLRELRGEESNATYSIVT